ncbi:hypothetical protein UFOVP997_15 [uncultured Caudovirales phage]|uniref:Uncharacterized protein n=1 Tax=uncultured Caudovirales phage TaxID=2100421 RepID=A0A6J5MGV2_9CAUD|nr:hypothetical protein UFOVP486_5 [uncultured Caudovirales phage]CAB4170322.1 hypothetical protein UFOVP911_37 [uncultured Caudovirales phage]CAB4177282.1 hypothetical protein UFOVP997_15 [uncultured Caudovirales phage]CAB4183224.1 hypothetical protein UFOVP1088_46 [uncultured Caudovirales phage]CAB4186418.1 hypothetical protein UFOVP1149_17 [uncultured Caudovirales phage]
MKINKNKKSLTIIHRGQATSNKRKQSIVNTRIIGSLYRNNNATGGKTVSDGGSSLVSDWPSPPI